MGRQPEQDNEDWDLPSDEVLRELSPLPETRQHSLFQRIARQRAAYFADVEDDPDSGEDEDYPDDVNSGKKSISDKDGGQREILLPPSAFADLSTWCCDALPPARPHSASPKKQFIRLASIVDQPTIVLSLLAPLPMHIADLPTQPDLIALSAPVMGSSLSSRNAFSLAGGKLWRVLAKFCQRLWRVRRMEERTRKGHIHKKRPPAKGRELVMERLRERQQSGIFAIVPIPPGERRPRQGRLPADRLLS